MRKQTSFPRIWEQILAKLPKAFLSSKSKTVSTGKIKKFKNKEKKNRVQKIKGYADLLLEHRGPTNTFRSAKVSWLLTSAGLAMQNIYQIALLLQQPGKLGADINPILQLKK